MASNRPSIDHIIIMCINNLISIVCDHAALPQPASYAHYGKQFSSSMELAIVHLHSLEHQTFTSAQVSIEYQWLACSYR